MAPTTATRLQGLRTRPTGETPQDGQPLHQGGGILADPTRTPRSLRRGSQLSGCGKCGRFFSTTRAFERHQRLTPGGGVECQDPATCGLVTTERGGFVWWSSPAPVFDAEHDTTHESEEE